MQHATIDGWTAVHAASGAVLGTVRVNRTTAYLLIIGTEVLEFILRRTFPDTRFFQETRPNIAADLIVGIAAYEIALNLRR